MKFTVKIGQKQVTCSDCGKTHLVRWNYKTAHTKCPTTKRVITLEVRS